MHVGHESLIVCILQQIGLCPAAWVVCTIAVSVLTRRQPYMIYKALNELLGYYFSKPGHF
jgi:hypothetical protein